MNQKESVFCRDAMGGGKGRGRGRAAAPGGTLEGAAFEGRKFGLLAVCIAVC